MGWRGAVTMRAQCHTQCMTMSVTGAQFWPIVPPTRQVSVRRAAHESRGRDTELCCCLRGQVFGLKMSCLKSPKSI